MKNTLNPVCFFFGAAAGLCSGSFRSGFAYSGHVSLCSLGASASGLIPIGATGAGAGASGSSFTSGAVSSGSSTVSGTASTGSSTSSISCSRRRSSLIFFASCLFATCCFLFSYVFLASLRFALAVFGLDPFLLLFDFDLDFFDIYIKSLEYKSTAPFGT